MLTRQHGIASFTRLIPPRYPRYMVSPVLLVSNSFESQNNLYEGKSRNQTILSCVSLLFYYVFLCSLAAEISVLVMSASGA
jgi:hypothetical protein